MDSISQENAPKTKFLDLSYQSALFPVPIVELYPSDGMTRHLRWFGKGEDNKDYAIKRVSEAHSNGLIPASELFCYELARSIFLPVPDYEVVKLRDIEFAFGSVIEGGMELDNPIMRVLMGDRDIKVHNPKQLLSRVYAFDLFVNNTDRSFQNYLVRSSRQGHIILIFDFSMAWYAGGDPFGYQALNPEYDTYRNHKIIKGAKHYFDAELARNTLTEIDKITTDKVQKILQLMPESWFSSTQRQEVIEWWDSVAKTERITRLKTEIR